MSVYDRLAAPKTPRSTSYPEITSLQTSRRRPNTSTAVSQANKRTYPVSPSNIGTGVTITTNTAGPKTSTTRSRAQLQKTKSVGNEIQLGSGTRVLRSAPIHSPSFPSDDSEIISTRICNLARAIKDSDYILIGAGAGFSADSGLAVYKDIAKVSAYSLMGLDYSSLCDPVWLKRSPEVFYGFWGHCFNTYRDTTPHQGYTIIRNMVAMYPEKLFFIYSSNVDSQFEKIGIPRQLIYEFHGTCMDWQCSRSCRADSVYRLPFHYRFNVNTQTMRCPANETLYAPMPRSPLSLNGKERQRRSLTPVTPGQRQSPIVCTNLYASQYIDGFAHEHNDKSSLQDIQEASHPSASKLVSNNVESRPALSTVSPDAYNRIYSQDSRYRNSDNTLQSALAKQGIDYIAIRNQARKACSTSAALIGPSTIHTTPTRNELTPPTAVQPTAVQLNIMEVHEKHTPSAIESNYRATYESVRPLTMQNPSSHPTCPWCRSYLRPRVLMFDDEMFIEITQEEYRYNTFKRKLMRSKTKRVCLIEIGCGLRIPTIRHEFESLLRTCTKSGITCTMFRINPERKRTRSVGHSADTQLHHIPRGGKETLLQVADILGIPY